MGLVILFVVTIVGMTMKFVLFYSSVQEADLSDISGTDTALDKELFNSVTEVRAQKITDKKNASADIRDPFSPVYVPPPLPDVLESDEEPAATDSMEDGSDLTQEPATE